MSNVSYYSSSINLLTLELWTPNRGQMIAEIIISIKYLSRKLSLKNAKPQLTQRSHEPFSLNLEFRGFVIVYC